MIGLLQRVNEASVHIDGEPVAEIDRGLAVLVGIQKNDDTGKADRLLERVLGYRV
ncbi:MAG: D-aminoacyl-tRNA deacylase, partial [Candidatus Thiodiazotropha endolucinida]